MLITPNDVAMKIQKQVTRRVMAHKWAVQLHGFYLDMKERQMHFDAVLSFDINPEQGVKILHQEIHKIYPKYDVQIIPDIDISTTE